MLRVKNKAEVAEIYLSGDIVDDDDGAAIRNWYEGDTTGYEFPQKLREQLKAIDEKSPLEIHINSCGGSVFAGMAMANFISSHKGKTTAINDGVAASIASVIFFSADNCKMPSNSYLMLHKPMTYLEGNADELRKAADILDTLQEGIENTYISKLQDNISLNDLKNMVNAETWMTGTDAAEKFKVEIMPPVKSLNAVGNVKKLKAIGLKIPESLIFLEETKIKSIDDETKIENALARAKEIVK